MKNIFLKDFAKVIRSKNAGPFEMTMDIVLKNQEDYLYIKENNIINRELISELYRIP